MNDDRYYLLAGAAGFRMVSDKFIQKFFSREGETVEKTRKRLSRK